MSIPISTDLIYYTNKALTDKDWKHNFDKIIEWLTSGNYSFNMNGLSIAGTLAVTGSITATGTITATSFIGDGSSLTGIGINNKNWLLNGGCQVDINENDVNLVLNTWATRANEWQGMVTGTAVLNGVYSRTDTGIGRTGSAILFSSVTLTGSGQINLRQQRSSNDSKKVKGQNVSIQATVYQDAGVPINYRFLIGKASATDNFTTVNNIATSPNIVVQDSYPTIIKFEDISLGDCSNGLEIKIQADCGVTIAKNFQFTEIQLEISPTITNFEHRPYNYECELCGVILPTDNLPVIGGFALKPAIDILQRYTCAAMRCKIRMPGSTGAYAGWYIAGYNGNTALIASSDIGVPLTTSSGIAQFLGVNAGDTVPVVFIVNLGIGADIKSSTGNWQINQNGTVSFNDISGNPYSFDDLIGISLIF